MPMKPRHPSTTSKSTQINAKWLNNAMKSIGVSTSNALNAIYPNLTESATTAAQATKKIMNQFRSGRAQSDRLQGAINNNKYVKFARKAYGNALEDIRSGNFNNEDRVMNNLMGGGDEDSFDFSFGDEDVSLEEPQQEMGTPSAMDRQTAAGFASITDQIQRSTEASLQTQRAALDAQFAIASNNMMLLQTLGTDITSHLSNVNNHLAAIVEYNNSNMTKYIEASLAYYNKVVGKEEADSETGSAGEDKVTIDRLFRGINGSAGGIKLPEYKKYVKQQLKATLRSSAGGMLDSMLSDDMLNQLADNPLGMMSEGLMKWMIPKMLGNTINNMETIYATMLPKLLNRIADWGDDIGNAGVFGTLKGFIGKTLGIRADRKGSLNAKIEKKPATFNTITDHAITEIIPKELREQTSYLRALSEKFKVDTEKARGNAEVFDYTNGKYIKVKKIQDEILGELRDSILDTFKKENKDQGRDTFGSRLYKMLDDVENEKDRKALEKGIDEFLINLTGAKRSVNPEDTSENSEYQRILQMGGSADEVKSAIDNYIRSMKDNDVVAYNDIARSIMSATQSYSSKLEDIEADPAFYNLWASGLNGRKDLIERIQKRFKNNKARELSTDFSQPVVAGSGSGDFVADFISEFSNITRGRARGVLNSVSHGDSQGATREILGTIGDSLRSIGRTMNDNFFTPLKNKIFGETDEEGNSNGGLFSSAKNAINDYIGNFKYGITGKAYTNSKGEHFDDTDDSMIGHLGRMGRAVKRGVMTKLFGEKRVDEEGNPINDDSQKGIFSKIGDSLKEGLVGWQEAFLGRELTEDEKKDKLKAMKEEFRKRLPSALTGAGIGAATSLLTGGSILGGIIGSPLLGATIGATVGFLAKNEKFQKFLFGEKDEDGNRLGGIISKKTQDFFKQHKDFLIGSSALGAVATTTGLKSAGMLGNIVGGPIAGALMGLGTGIVLKSKMFDRFLHGDPEKGQKGVIDAVRDAFNKSRRHQQGDGFTATGKSMGMAAIGLGGGVLTGAMIAKMGIFGAALGPLGPIGGGLLGLGLSIKAQGNTFKSWLFGEDIVGEDGVKRHKTGIIGQFGNMLNASVFRPLIHESQYLIKYTGQKIEHTLLDPLKFAAEDIAGGLGKVFNNVQEKLVGTFNTLGGAIKKTAADLLAPVFKPIGNALSKGADFFVKSVVNTALMPANLLKLGLNVVHSKIAEFTAPIFNLIKDVRKLIFGGIKKLFGYGMKLIGGVLKVATTPLRFVGGLVGTGVNKVNQGITKRLERRGISGFRYDTTEGSIGERIRRANKNAKIERVQLEAEKRRWKEHDKNAKLIAKYTKNQYSSDTEEAREALKRMNYDKYLKLTGVSEDADKAKAKLEREGMSTAGMSSDQLSRQDPSKLNEEARQTYFLQGIFNIMRGKSWNGKDPQNTEAANETEEERITRENREREDRAQQEREREREEAERAADTQEGSETFDAGGGSSFKEFFKGFFKNLKQEAFGGYRTDDEGKRLVDENGQFIYDPTIGDKIRKFGANEWNDVKKVKEAWSRHRAEDAEKIQNIKDERARNKEAREEERARIRRLRRTGGRGIGRGYAEGTDNATPGLHPINEHNVPEVIITDGKPKLRRFQGGERVIPTDLKNPLPVLIQDMSKKVADELNDQSDDDKLKNASIKRASLAETAMSKAIDRGTTKEEREAELAKEEKRSYRNTVIDTLKETGKTAKSHLSNWLGIFSKKGLITAGVMLLAPFISKLFKLDWGGIANTIGNVASVVGGIASKIAGFSTGVFSDILDQIKNLGKRDREDGNSATEQMQEEVDDVVNGNIVTDENGNATHHTDARATFLGRTALNFVNSGYKTPFASRKTKNQKRFFNGVKNAAKKSADIAAKFKEGSAYKTIKTTGTSIKSGAKNLVQGGIAEANAAVGTTRAGAALSSAKTKVASRAAKVGAALGTVKTKAATMLDTGVKNNKLLDKVCGIIKQFFEFITKKVAGKGFKITKDIWGAVNPQKLINALKSKWTTYADDVAEKITRVTGLHATGAGLTAGLSEVAFTALGAINGASGAAKLFEVDQKDVDGTMILISTILGGVTSTTIGSYMDIILQVLSAITKIDILRAVAVSLYKLMKGDDSEAVKALETAQSNFSAKYEDYKENEIKKQYETQKKAGIIDASKTLDDFKADVKSGKARVTYKSFADYNTQQHKSLGDKAVETVAKPFKWIRNSMSKLVNGTESYKDEKGNVYTKNDSGNYNVKSSSGEDLGYVSKKSVDIDTMERQSSGFSLKKVGSSIVGGVKGLGSKIGNLFSGKNEEREALLSGKTIYRHKTNGGYYKLVGRDFNFYSSNGTLITQGVSMETVKDMAMRGIVVEETDGKVVTTKKDTTNEMNKKMDTAINKSAASFMKLSLDQVTKNLKEHQAKNKELNDAKFTFGDIDKKTIYNDLSSPGCYYTILGGKLVYCNANHVPIRKVSTTEFEERMKLGQVSFGKKMDKKEYEKALEAYQKNKEKVDTEILDQLKTVNDETQKATKDRLTKTQTNIIDIFDSKKWQDPLKGKNVYYLGADKGYIKKNGSSYEHHSMTGDLLKSNLTKEQVHSLILGGFSATQEEEQDPEAQKAVSAIKTSTKGFWETTKMVASTALDNVSNWFKKTFGGGGSGSGTSATKLMMSGTQALPSSGIVNPGGNGRGRSNIIPFPLGGGRGTNAPSSVNDFPYYSQNDSRWKNKSYGNDASTIGDSGCGPTAMSMVASKVTGRKADPTAMAALAEQTGDRDETGTNWNFINKASNVAGIRSVETFSPNREFIDRQMDAGNPMILSGTSGGHGNSPYTPAGHYVVAAGKDGNGRIKINDPRGRQYSRSYTSDELAEETSVGWTFPMGGRGKKANTKKKGEQAETKKESNGIGFTAEDVIRVAQAEIGYKEKASNANLDDPNANPGSANYTKYNAAIISNPNYWCCSFVTWCFLQAANGNKALAQKALCGAWTGLCSAVESAFRNAGRYDNKPQVGDVVLFNTSRKGGAGHIGIVAGVTANEIITIEGNTTEKGFNDNGGMVAQKAYQISDTGRIRGYGHPLYDGVSNFKGITGNGVASSGINSSSAGGGTVQKTDFFSAFSTIMGSLGSRVMTGLTTGNWDSDFSSLFATNTESGNNDTGVSGTVTAGGIPSSLQGSETKEKIWNFLRSKGISANGAAGAMGCWESETGNDPNTLEGWYLNKGGKAATPGIIKDNASLDAFTTGVLFPAYQRSGQGIDESGYKFEGHYYPGMGLAQWTGIRALNLKKYADANNADWGALDTQLGYFMNGPSEFNTRAGLLDKLNAAASPEDAATVFLDGFEMSEGWSQKPKGQEQNAERRANARNIFDQYKDLQVTDSEDTKEDKKKKNKGKVDDKKKKQGGGKGTGKKSKSVTATKKATKGNVLPNPFTVTANAVSDMISGLTSSQIKKSSNATTTKTADTEDEKMTIDYYGNEKDEDWVTPVVRLTEEMLVAREKKKKKAEKAQYKKEKNFRVDDYFDEFGKNAKKRKKAKQKAEKAYTASDYFDEFGTAEETVDTTVRNPDYFGEFSNVPDVKDTTTVPDYFNEFSRTQEVTNRDVVFPGYFRDTSTTQTDSNSDVRVPDYFGEFNNQSSPIDARVPDYFGEFNNSQNVTSTDTNGAVIETSGLKIQGANGDYVNEDELASAFSNMNLQDSNSSQLDTIITMLTTLVTNSTGSYDRLGELTELGKTMQNTTSKIITQDNAKSSIKQTSTKKKSNTPKKPVVKDKTKTNAQKRNEQIAYLIAKGKLSS